MKRRALRVALGEKQQNTQIVQPWRSAAAQRPVRGHLAVRRTAKGEPQKGIQPRNCIAENHV